MPGGRLIGEAGRQYDRYGDPLLALSNTPAPFAVATLDAAAAARAAADMDTDLPVQRATQNLLPVLPPRARLKAIAKKAAKARWSSGVNE